MKNRNVLMILVMFLVISVFVGGTFAYWTWSSKENQRTNVVVLADGDLFSCSADGGGLIDSSTVTVMPASCTNVNNAIIREVTVNVDLITSNASTYLDLWLNIDDIAPELSNSQNLRYSLTTSSSSCDVGGGLSGSFNGIVIGDRVHILRKTYTSDEPTTYTETYYLYIWLDAAETNIETAGKGFQFSLGGECADYVEDTSPSIEVSSNNNVSSTQTVSLNLTDDYGIASYYYGTTDPSSNDVTWIDIQFPTSKTESVTIDSSGLWYFAVKDSSDNVVVVNKEFYETTLSVSNGTVTPTTVLTMSGDTFTLPIPVFGENYNFGGWYVSSDYSGSSMTTYMPTSNSTLYANIVVDATYTVSYDANGGTNAPDVQIKIDNTDLVISNNVPMRVGYTFLGWSDVADATTATYQPGGVYTNNANITLYAVWQITTYTVTYNYGDLIYGKGNASETIATGSFNGNFIYSITDDVITATGDVTDSYGYIPYRVYLEAGRTYIFNGETSGTWNGQVEVYLALNGTTANTFYRMGSKNNYKFTPTQSGEYWFRLDVNTPNEVHTFSNLNISYDVDTKSIAYGQSYGDMPSVSRTGYTLSGWYTKINGGTKVTDSTTMNTPNAHTLYAQWSPNTYAISVHPNGGTIPSTSGWTAIDGLGTYKKTITYNSVYGTLPIPSRTGYTFSGWYDVSQPKTINLSDPNGLKYVYDSIMDNVYPGATYTITMDSAVLNSGTATKFHSFVYDSTDEKTVSDEVLMDFSSNVITYSLTVPQTVDPTHNLKILIYAGVWGSTSGNSVTYNNVRVSAIGASTATKYQSANIVTYNENHMLFAHWSPNIYTVSYDANGGTGAPANQTKTHGVTLTLSSVKPTRDNYTFLGWSTDKNATSATYSAGGSYTLNESKTLYAVWKSPLSCDINASFNNNVLTLNATYSETDGNGISYYGWDSSYSGSNSTSKTVSSSGVVNYYVKDNVGNTNSCSINISNATVLYTCSKSSRQYTSVACSSSNYSSPQSACTSSGYGYSSNSCTMGYYYQVQYNTCRLSNSGTYSFVPSEEGGKKSCSIGSSFGCNASTVGRNYVYGCKQLTSSPYYEGSISCYYHYCSSGTRDGNYCYLYDQGACSSGWSSTISSSSCSNNHTYIDGSTYCYYKD